VTPATCSAAAHRIAPHPLRSFVLAGLGVFVIARAAAAVGAAIARGHRSSETRRGRDRRHAVIAPALLERGYRARDWAPAPTCAPRMT
jgi:hypothetical protein